MCKRLAYLVRIAVKYTATVDVESRDQRAGIAPPHAEGDGLSGVTSDGRLGGVSAFISVPA